MSAVDATDSLGSKGEQARGGVCRKKELCGSLCDLCGEGSVTSFHHRDTEEHRVRTEKLLFPTDSGAGGRGSRDPSVAPLGLIESVESVTPAHARGY
jgi:hypothetical protein